MDDQSPTTNNGDQPGDVPVQGNAANLLLSARDNRLRITVTDLEVELVSTKGVRTRADHREEGQRGDADRGADKERKRDGGDSDDERDQDDGKREGREKSASRDKDDQHGTGDQDDAKKSEKKSLLHRPAVLIAGAAILLVLIIGVLLWWWHARQFESTDDAFIDARVVRISPRISGQVTGVHAEDNQLVHTPATSWST